VVVFIIKTPMSVEKGRIYKIINKENGLVYIGCTIYSLKKRFNEHIHRCFKTDYKSKLYNSIKKYGVENFVIELIDECDLNIIYETEKKYIEQYDSFKNGLNSTLGGEGCLGYTHSPEIRKKISEKIKNGDSHKGKTYDELYGERADEEKEKRRLSVKNKWVTMSDDDKKKRSNSSRKSAQKNSKYGVELITEIKQKINNGAKFKEIKEQYPKIKDWLYYSLKNNQRWSNI
jgi:group I intron endonuclease